LQKGKIFTLNAQGLVEEPSRNAQDGITYFGCKKRDKRVSKEIKVKIFRE